MSNTDEEPQEAAERVRPNLRIGLWLTAAAVVAVVLYLQLKAMAAKPAQSIGELLITISVADIGQFISGVAGALAFLWLVLAYQQQNRQLEMQQQELKLQRRELSLQRAETKRLADEATAQVQELRLSRQGSGQDAFVRALDFYERLLVYVVADIYASYCLIYHKSMKEHGKALTEFGQGDRYAIFRRLLEGLDGGVKIAEFFQALEDNEGGHWSVFYFCDITADVLRRAEQVDADVVSLCKFTPWHHLYTAFKRRMDGTRWGQLYELYTRRMGDARKTVV